MVEDKNHMGQHWENCNPEVNLFVSSVVNSSRDILADNLVSVLLHGSLAMGSYYFPKSDVDILVVVDKPLSPDLRKKYFIAIAAISEKRPSAGDVELSVVRANALSNLENAVPYEVHYSEEIKNSLSEFDFAKERSDYDLPAHFMVAYHKGIALFGKNFSDIAPEPPWEKYRESVKGDLEWILSEENILSTPFYSVLNCCRAYCLLALGENSVLSKEDGAEWALINLPQVKPIVEKALAAYRSSRFVTSDERRHNGESWDKVALLAFRDEMRRLFRK